MTTHKATPPTPAHVDQSKPASNGQKIDWVKVAQSAAGSMLLGALVAGGAHMLAKIIEAQRASDADAEKPTPTEYAFGGFHESLRRMRQRLEAQVPSPPAPSDDPKVRAAADTLGIAIDASQDEIRAALRWRLSMSRLHPDHGGDGEEATRLINAKNLLITHARSVGR